MSTITVKVWKEVLTRSSVKGLSEAARIRNYVNATILPNLSGLATLDHLDTTSYSADRYPAFTLIFKATKKNSQAIKEILEATLDIDLIDFHVGYTVLTDRSSGTYSWNKGINLGSQDFPMPSRKQKAGAMTGADAVSSRPTSRGIGGKVYKQSHESLKNRKSVQGNTGAISKSMAYASKRDADIDPTLDINKLCAMSLRKQEAVLKLALEQKLITPNEAIAMIKHLQKLARKIKLNKKAKK